MAQSAVLLAVDALAAACKRQSVRIRRDAGRTAGDYSIALCTAMWLLLMFVQQQVKMTMFWQPIHPGCDPGREALRVAVPRLGGGNATGRPYAVLVIPAMFCNA